VDERIIAIQKMQKMDKNGGIFGLEKITVICDLSIYVQGYYQ
jgi:hypothetical protein